MARRCCSPAHPAAASRYWSPPSSNSSATASIYSVSSIPGDYSAVPDVGVIGGPQSAPTANEVLQLLEQANTNVVVNLLGVGIEDRPEFFEALMPQLVALRMRTGRPHFIVVDEAHHLAPRGAPTSVATAAEWSNVLLVTVHPKHVAQALLQSVDIAVAGGAAPAETISEFALGVDETPPALDAKPLDPGEGAELDHVHPARRRRRRLHVAVSPGRGRLRALDP